MITCRLIIKAVSDPSYNLGPLHPRRLTIPFTSQVPASAARNQRLGAPPPPPPPEDEPPLEEELPDDDELELLEDELEELELLDDELDELELLDELDELELLDDEEEELLEPTYSSAPRS